MRIQSQSWVLPVSFVAAAAVALALIGGFWKLKSAEAGGVPTGLTIVLGIFGLVGLGLLYAGLKSLVSLWRHGSWSLDCQDGGGVLGQRLPVTILPAKPITVDGEVEWRLRCIERNVTRHRQRSGGTHTHTTGSTLWETGGTLRVTTLTPQHGMTFDLPLPENGMASREQRTGTSIIWQVNVVVPILGGGSHESFFDVPVRQPGGARGGRLPD
jgi:hypothetical protein